MGKKRRQHPNTIQKTKGVSEVEHLELAAPDLNQIALAPVGRRGAGAALGRLESVEERAFVRLQRAIEEGDPFKTRQAQEFYLKSSEVLRRLDIAVLTERRQAGEQVPLTQIEDVARQISEWLRVAFERFLAAESPALVQTEDLGTFKAHAIESFRGILHREVKTALMTNPTILPTWAADRVREAWNINPDY